jgi:putative transposase
MMTKDTMTRLLDQIQASTDGDFLRAIAAHTLQRLMEFEVDSLIGAGRHERSDERTTYRNGYRDRQLETRLGTLVLSDLGAACRKRHQRVGSRAHFERSREPP